MFMFPSSDDIFDILIKIQLQSGLYEEYSIDPSFQADISFEYIFIFKRVVSSSGQKCRGFQYFSTPSFHDLCLANNFKTANQIQP